MISKRNYGTSRLFKYWYVLLPTGIGICKRWNKQNNKFHWVRWFSMDNDFNACCFNFIITTNSKTLCYKTPVWFIHPSNCNNNFINIHPLNVFIK